MKWVIIGILAVGVVAIGLSVAGQSPSATTPVAIDPGAVAAGEQLYQANCAACHGPDLRGTAVGPPFLDVIYAPNHHSDESFQRAAEVGVQPHHWNFGPMPAVGANAGLTRDDVALIVAYVRSEQEAAGIFNDPSH
ncbi:MAG: hypothetical protein A2Z12_10225 [Actinobacteria bacterium RBG_16_68_21]|nr:MAG: hypothetical protein A2Z12_10225 [Actinobacteria bacterium RBG_16_68_21]